MLEFLKIQYQMGKVTVESLQLLIGKRITQAEYELIVGGEE